MTCVFCAWRCLPLKPLACSMTSMPTILGRRRALMGKVPIPRGPWCTSSYMSRTAGCGWPQFKQEWRYLHLLPEHLLSLNILHTSLGRSSHASGLHKDEIRCCARTCGPMEAGTIVVWGRCSSMIITQAMTTPCDGFCLPHKCLVVDTQILLHLVETVLDHRLTAVLPVIGYPCSPLETSGCMCNSP